MYLPGPADVVIVPGSSKTILRREASGEAPQSTANLSISGVAYVGQLAAGALQVPLGTIHSTIETGTNPAGIFQCSVTGVSPGQIVLRKSRGTAAAPGLVADGDYIGAISAESVADETPVTWVGTAGIHFLVNGTVVGDGTAPPVDIILQTGSTERMRIAHNGRVTSLGLFTPNKLAIPHSAVTLSNGDNNDVAVQTNGILRVVGPTAAYGITGLTTPVAGERRTILNTVGFTLTVKHENVSSTAANRFKLQSGSDLSLTQDQSATFWYDSVDTRWRQVN
jgi:hypothetical protein